MRFARENAGRPVHRHPCRYGARPRARGATIYTLSEKASDAEAEALAHKENRADIIGGIDLGTESEE